MLVPTCRRPEYLSNCLQSIANQSRSELIENVIVSENSPDPRSETVVRAFAEILPIHFRRQNPDLPMYAHFLELVRSVKSSYVALIGDDDMWGRYHLEEAARAFAELPTAKSFFGQCVYTCSETCYPLANVGPTLLQAPFNHDRRLQEFFLWDRRHTAMQCMSNTPLNIWALVSETTVLRAAMDLVFRDPRFSTPRQAPSADKMLIWKLSNLGPIAVSRNITMYYRRHYESTQNSLYREDNLAGSIADSEMSLEISRQAADLGIHAFQDWQDTFNYAKNNYRLHEFIAPGTICLREFMNPKSKPSRQQLLRQKFNRLVHLFVPPVVPLLLAKLRSRLAQL